MTHHLKSILITAMSMLLVYLIGATLNSTDENILEPLPVVESLAQTPADSIYYNRLYFLCRAWGHAKYFHSEIAAGTVNWDDALLTAVAGVQSATSNTDFNDVINTMLNSAGVMAQSTDPLPEVIDSLNNNADHNWIYDPIFSSSASATLDTIRVRFRPQPNVYVTKGGAGNPLFDDDTQYYSGDSYPTEDLRILAMFRYWNIINYFFPYKDIMDQDWDSTFFQFIPSIVGAIDAISYHLSLKEFITQINDTHGVLTSATYQGWDGQNHPPFNMRHIEGQSVITMVLDGITAVQVGDIITEIDGVDINTLRDSLRPYAHGSNGVIAEHSINRSILYGQEGDFQVTVDNGTSVHSETLTRNGTNWGLLNPVNDTIWSIDTTANGCHIGVVDMGELTGQDVDLMFSELWDTDAIVFDIRSYPNGTLWTIVDYLFPSSVRMANFTVPDHTYPGRLYWIRPSIGQGTTTPYSGTVIILFDERTQSQAEYTCMGLDTYTDVIKIGSTTSGADGNVSYINLPGVIRTRASFLGVFYPDYTPTQRVGIIPDYEILPTIEGVRNGIDEVMRYALDSTLFCTPDSICDAQETFPDNPLTHQGAGSSATTIDFSENADFPYFTVSDIGQKLKGKPGSQYIDIVTVSYLYSSGDTIEHQYSGADVDSVNVEIFNSVQSITVSLENGLASSNATIGVTMSAVTYCGISDSCPDDDSDGVCNADDICPGGDDNVDSDSDGTPDFCDSCPNDPDPACQPSGCSNPASTDFNTNPLTHSGSGTSTSTLDFGAGNNHTDIAFTITRINQKLNGPQSRRYIEEVVVKVDGIVFDEFSGAQVTSADVSIPGPANLIEVILYDSYDGDVQQGSMSIDFTSVSSCAPNSAPTGNWTDEIQTFNDTDMDVRLYPNPSSGKAYIEFAEAPAQGQITVRDILGRTIAHQLVSGEAVVELDLSNISAQQILFVAIEVDGQSLRTLRLVIVE